MTIQAFDWGASPIEFFERFAAPGELPRLLALARRVANCDDDFEALTNGVFPLFDALEATGHSVERVLEAIDGASGVVDAWRSLAELPRKDIERVIAFARRACRG